MSDHEATAEEVLRRQLIGVTNENDQLKKQIKELEAAKYKAYQRIGELVANSDQTVLLTEEKS